MGAAAEAIDLPPTDRAPGDRATAVAGRRAGAGFAEIQRARILTATRLVACEQGAAQLTVASIVARAGVSRRTFYEIYGDVEACLLDTLRDSLEWVGERSLPLYRDTALGPWHERLRAALGEGLLCFDERPDVARLLAVEWLGGGALAAELRRRTLAAILAGLQADRDVPESRSSPIVAEALVGGVLAIVHSRLCRPDPPPLAPLTSELMGLIALQCLGPDAAQRELARPAPLARAAIAGESAAEALHGLQIRLTYRTVRVLGAIARRPGSSNRSIAVAAGIEDQGQISKLLRRLQRLELIENTVSRAERSKGEPNAWRLTPRGEHVERLVRAV